MSEAVASVSPKKRALMPSSILRRTLRGVGHTLSPVVQIGKEGTTSAVLRQLQSALHTHELVKVRLGSECPESRFGVADRLAEERGAQIAQILGRTILVYKRHPRSPKFEGAAAPKAPVRPSSKSHLGKGNRRIAGKIRSDRRPS